MGSSQGRALVRRGIGELYVMVIIIVILVIALTIMYTVMNGFTKYMMEQKQEIVKLESAKVSLKTGLKSLTCGGGSCIVTVGVSGTTIITGSKAVCVLSSTVMNVTSPCNYALGNDWSVEVAIPSELISDANSIVGGGGYSYITIYLPGSDGLVPSIALYMGYVIAYAVLNSTGNYAVIVVNNSTGWVNATLLVNNQPYSSHVVPPTGSYAFTNVPGGTYTLLVNGIINEVIPVIKLAQSAQTVPVPPQCNYFRVYYDNGSLIGFNSAGASSNAPGAGSNPGNNIAIYGTAMITNNVLGATAPIHYSSEMIITAPPPEYAMWIYYASGYSINAYTYNSFAATIYPTLYTPNETMYFVFVKVSTGSGNYVYASILSINYPVSPASNYEAPGSCATSQCGANGAWFQTLLARLVLGNAGDYRNVIIVSEGNLLENTWQVIKGVIPSNVGSSAKITEVGFGTFFVYSNQAPPGQTALPGPPNGLWYPGNMYIDYLCVGQS
ncbi:MAG: hypothetical protein RXR10_08710 [Vulcanisaeta sp.]